MTRFSINRRTLLSRSAVAAAGVIGVAPLSRTAFAQAPASDYPSRTVRIVVPYSPGGITDTLTRVFGAEMQQSWKQPVIVDNRPGAATNIGSAEVARSKPDGYTLLLASPTLVTNPALFPGKLGYDPAKDFTGVSVLIRNPNAVFVPANSPFATLADLIAYGKAHPGELTYGHPGTGALPHLSAELLAATAGIKMVPVPYKGTAPVMTDLLGGQLSLAVDNFPGYLQHVRTGRVRALVILGPERISAAPEIPSIADAGFKGFDGTGWSGISAPAGTPAAVIDKLSTELQRIARLPSIRKQFETPGFVMVGSSADEMNRWTSQEASRWQDLIRQRGIRAD